MRRFTSIFKRSDKAETHSFPDSDAPNEVSVVKRPSRLFRSLPSRQKASSARPPIPPVTTAPYSSSSTSSTDSPSPPTPNEDVVAFHSLTKSPWTSLKIAKVQYPAGESEDECSSATTSSSRSEATTPRSVAPIVYAQGLTSNKLVATFSVPPLLHLPGNPLFPRSSNSMSTVPFQETTESTLHRTQLLRRLERRELTDSEELSLAPFLRRRFTPTKRIPAIRLDEDAVKYSKRISRTSHGLKIWAARPCFEDRAVIFSPASPSSPLPVDVHRVTGSLFGVAALEFSQGLEALAGLADYDEPWSPPSAASSSSSLSAPAPVQPRNQPYKSNPSPLRIETLPPSSRNTSSVPQMNVTAGRAKNTVRFDIDGNEGKEDQIPLGQIMRIKKGREEKAKFLELQRQRRAHEEERQRHEAERKQWEKEKLTWEAEKRAIEEENRKKQYAQELLAARKRRESQIYKVGLSPPDIADPGHVTRQQTQNQSYSRPHYDPRRQSSPGPGALSNPGDESPTSSKGTTRSRVDSRPPSLHSQPPSTHTRSSAEDVRLRDKRLSMNNMVPLPMDPRKDFMPIHPQFAQYAWSPVPPMPQVPFVPFYNPNVDYMPLLPPTPPFMMQQHGNRRQSSNSSPPRESLPVSRSAERFPSSDSTKRYSGHQRHSSGEIQASKRISVASRTTSSPTVPSTKDRKSYTPRASSPKTVIAPPIAYTTLPPWAIRRQTTIT